MEVTVYLGIGTNIEPRTGFILKALQLLSLHDGIVLKRLSSIYRASPLGNAATGEFLNLVAEIVTRYSQEELFEILKRTEKEAGRIQRVRWGAREIDIDILLYGDMVYHSETLDIPHRGLMERDFFVIPMLELHPAVVNPESGEKLSSIIFKAENSFVTGKYVPVGEQSDE